MHHLRMDLRLRLIDVTIEGLCSMDDVADYIAELRTMIARFPPGPTPPASLYNFTNAMIQTQEIVAALIALAEREELRHRIVALYTEGALARRQAQRIADRRDNMRVFDNRQSALDWIAVQQAAQGSLVSA